MGTTNKETLKGYFKAGSIPKESNFADLIDSVLLIDGTGKVGIGTVTPSGKLNISEPIGTPATPAVGTLIFDHENNGGASSIVFRSKVNRGSDYGYIQFQDAATIGGAGESALLKIGIENDADDHIALLPSGNVGIGTITPLRKLEVNNAMRFTNDSNDKNDGVIGTAPFNVGLNIVGINTDTNGRKISIWGSIKQHQNDSGNSFAGETTFAGNIAISGTINQDAWQDAALTAPWTDYGGGWAKAEFYKSKDGCIHLKGLVKGGLVGTTIFTLPPGYRPTGGARMFCVNTWSTGYDFARIDILIDGRVLAQKIPPGPSQWTQLDGIYFRP